MLQLVQHGGAARTAAPARSPAASSSAWRWPARWRRSPKVLLLDEPLSALDYKLRKEMQIELKRLQHETGITFVFVTHDQEEALTMSDRIAVMSAGKILQIGTPREIYDRPAERFVADFIGETNFLEGEVVRRRTAAATVTLASGAEVAAAVPEGAPADGQVTVVVRPEHAALGRDAARRRLPARSRTSSISAPTRNIHVRARRRRAVHRAPAEHAAAARRGFEPGEPVGIALGADAAQVLRD